MTGSNTTADGARLPRWLGPANRVIIALQHRGVVIGTMRLLSVPGRKSGKMRTTPVSPLTVDGQRYSWAASREPTGSRMRGPPGGAYSPAAVKKSG